jgi:hypothetical protein
MPMWSMVALALIAGCAGNAKQVASRSGPSPGYQVESTSRVASAMDRPMADDDGGASYDAEEAPAPGAVPAMAPAPARPAPPPGGAQARAQGQPPGAGPAQVAAGEPAQPLLIYTANLHLGVYEAVSALDAIEALARKSGGYLVHRTDTTIVVRVPAAGFGEALAEVARLGDVLHREVTAQDVTAEFRDLEIRLKNLLAVRGRLEQLLAQAKTVPEALQVERELERVTMQIEQIKGRLKLLGELVAFSTIQVSFKPRPVEQVGSVVVLPFPWLDDLGLKRLLDLSY